MLQSGYLSHLPLIRLGKEGDLCTHTSPPRNSNNRGNRERELSQRRAAWARSKSLGKWARPIISSQRAILRPPLLALGSMGHNRAGLSTIFVYIQNCPPEHCLVLVRPMTQFSEKKRPMTLLLRNAAACTCTALPLSQNRTRSG